MQCLPDVIWSLSVKRMAFIMKLQCCIAISAYFILRNHEKLSNFMLKSCIFMQVLLSQKGNWLI